MYVFPSSTKLSTDSRGGIDCRLAAPTIDRRCCRSAVLHHVAEASTTHAVHAVVSLRGPPGAEKMFKGCVTMKDNLEGFILVSQKARSKGEEVSRWVDMSLSPKEFITHCRTYATQGTSLCREIRFAAPGPRPDVPICFIAPRDLWLTAQRNAPRRLADANIDWERKFDMDTHEEAVMAHHREFRKIVLKYGWNTDEKAGDLADFLTDASSGASIDPREFAAK